MRMKCANQIVARKRTVLKRLRTLSNVEFNVETMDSNDVMRLKTAFATYGRISFSVKGILDIKRHSKSSCMESTLHLRKIWLNGYKK